MIFNPKNVTIASGFGQNKKLPYFQPIGQKLYFFNVKFSSAIENSKFSCNMSIFWPIGQKDGNFLFWSTTRANMFLGLKNHTRNSKFMIYHISYTELIQLKIWGNSQKGY